MLLMKRYLHQDKCWSRCKLRVWTPLVFLLFLYFLLLLSSVLVSDDNLLTDELETDISVELGDLLTRSEMLSPSVPVVTEVCLVSDNPRTSSIFNSGYLTRRGRGSFQYLVFPLLADCIKINNERATKGRDELPIIKMSLQIGLNPLFTKLKKFGIVEKTSIIVSGDEYCRCPKVICSSSEKVSARQYYSLDFEPYATSSVENHSNPPMYLPIGPRFDVVEKFSKFQVDAAIPLKRKYLFNFMGSLTSAERKKLKTVLSTEEALIQQYNSFVHITNGWSRKSADEAESYLDSDQYVEILMQSTFTLCPMGHNAEAFRFFEAMEALSIPIIVTGSSSYTQHACKDSLLPFTEAQKANNAQFMIVLDSWSELPKILEEFSRSPNIIVEMQNNLKEFRNNFWKQTALRFECMVLRKHNGNLEDRCLIDAETEEQPSFIFDERFSITHLQGDGVPEFPQQQGEYIADSLGRSALITGCGRSGTYSVFKFLDEVGVKAVHEGFKQRHITVSWLYGVPDKRYPFEFAVHRKNRALFQKKLPKGESVFSKVYHLVRHPLKVMSSTRRCFCGIGKRYTKMGRKADLKSWRFAQKHLNLKKYSSFFNGSNGLPPQLSVDDIKRSALYWLNWNKLLLNLHPNAEKLRLEEITPVSLLQSLNMSGKNTTSLPEAIGAAAFHVSPEKPKNRYKDLSWSDVAAVDRTMAEEIFNLAQLFGYESGVIFQDVALVL